MDFPGPDDPDENQDGIERTDDDLYESYSKLIPIYYQGKEYMVPENNTLLRVLAIFKSGSCLRKLLLEWGLP